MIKIDNVDVYGIARAVYSSRNAMNSWDKSDSDLHTDILGDADLGLAKKLSKAGSDHAKYKRMINVTCDIVAPLYWWKEFDTYKVGTVANSCSTMHKIHEKEFTLDDFSYEHLDDDSLEVMNKIIESLNECRDIYVNGYEHPHYKIQPNDKDYWWQMIQLLPSSYNQRRTIQLNYEVLTNMYHSRKNHKLDEWREFCRWIESLPYSELITEEENNEVN